MKKIFLLLILALGLRPAWASTDTTSITPAKKIHLPVVRLFTDKKDCTYTHPYPPENASSVVLFKNNKRWVDTKLNGPDKSGVYIGMDKKDLTPYLEKVALQFYIRGNKGGETLSSVGFRMAIDAKHKYNFESTVPLGDYCGVTTKWQMVTIPLSEFPISGKHLEIDENERRLEKAMNEQIKNSTDQMYTTHFLWDQVTEVEFEHTHDDNADTEIEISNVVIVPEYKYKVVLKEKEAMQ